MPEFADYYQRHPRRLGGREGVETVLKMLLAELDLTLALAGQTSIADLGPERLAREPA